MAGRRRTRSRHRRRPGAAAGSAPVWLPLPRTKPRPGPCCPSVSASSRPPGCATTSSATTAKPTPFPPLRRCGSLSWNCPAARASIFTPSRTPPWKAGWTPQHCARSNPDQAIRTVQEIKGLGPFAAELVVIRGATAPSTPPPWSPRLGDPSAPGLSSTYVPSRNNAPQRSAAEAVAADHPMVRRAPTRRGAMHRSAPCGSWRSSANGL